MCRGHISGRALARPTCGVCRRPWQSYIVMAYVVMARPTCGVCRRPWQSHIGFLLLSFRTRSGSLSSVYSTGNARLPPATAQRAANEPSLPCRYIVIAHIMSRVYPACYKNILPKIHVCVHFSTCACLDTCLHFRVCNLSAAIPIRIGYRYRIQTVSTFSNRGFAAFVHIQHDTDRSAPT